MMMKTIVAAIDLDDKLAQAVVLAARDLAAREGASVHVVSVWPELTAAAGGYINEFAPSTAATLTEETLLADKEARAAEEKRLNDLVGKLAPGAEAAMLHGEPAYAIAGYARDRGADVIVAGSHQRGFWGSLFAGASSREVVREAPCAVFLVTEPYAKKLKAQRN